MENCFHLDPSTMLVDIKLVMTFSPRVNDNRIVGRAFNSFLHIISGRYSYSFCGGSFEAGAGDTVYLPAGSTPYHYHVLRQPSEEVRCLQIELALTEAKSGRQLAYADCPVLLPAAHRDAMRAAMEEMLAVHTSSRLRALSALFQMLALLEQTEDGKNRDSIHRLITPAKAYIEAHYREEISAARLASLCLTSESQLRRRFHATLGMSPMAYKRQLLLADAKRLLALGEFQIGEIAEMLGFCDIYAFSHFFKETEGVSPREYAQRNCQFR